MNFSFPPKVNRDKVFQRIEEFLLKTKFNIIAKDDERPWGGFFVIDEKQSELFIKYFFSDLKQEKLLLANKISPKILIVEPQKKLSWQYHFRRAELWKVIGGEAGVAKSKTDKEMEMEKFLPGSVIKLECGERHRLIGLNTWGILAEIWQHTDTNYPSDEDDIVRIQDDYGR